MARDTTKYKWVLIGIPYGEVLEQLEAEASSFHETLPTYMRNLHIDRHEALQGKRQERWFPRGFQVPIPIQQASSPETIHPDEERMLANASSAAAAWTSDWDDEPTERLPIVRGA